LGSIEVDIARGGVWAADLSRLWRFDGPIHKKREFISAVDAQRSALRVLTKYGILLDLNGPFQLRTRTAGTTTVISANGTEDRQVFKEDVTVLADIEIDVSEHGWGKKYLPMVGGGGRFGVIFGDGGVYSAVADYDGNRVPLRKIIIPATDVVQPTSQPSIQPTRAGTAKPLYLALEMCLKDGATPLTDCTF
jgi:hypothetical protein